MELPDLGEHCAKCNQLDYLPFKCNECNKFYCINHSTVETHGCKIKLKKPKPAQRLKPIKKYKCSLDKCKTKATCKYTCPDCYKNYCIKHRHHFDHSTVRVR